MASIETWKQKSGIEIDEVDFDGDAHAFKIYFENVHVLTVFAFSPEETVNIRASLNAGEDVRDWEDGNGVSVGTHIKHAWR